MSAAVAEKRTRGLAADQLARIWSAVTTDPAIKNLPYRIELNKWGHIEMTPPASPRHMDIATTLAGLLKQALGGKVLTECAIVTIDGVRIADVAWCSPEFVARHKSVFEDWEASLPQAPALCIEVMSPSNIAAELREKVDLYLEAGAEEVWIVHSDMRIEIFHHDGVGHTSRFALDLNAIRNSLCTA